MPHTQPVRRLAVNLNGITIAYVMGLVNALLATLLAYGVHLTDEEIATTAALVNASLVLAVHVGHRVGESVASGAASRTSQVHNDDLLHRADLIEKEASA